MKIPIRTFYIAAYQGKELRVFRDKGDLFLEGKDKDLLSDGFVEKHPGRFYKKVDRNELEKVFLVTPFVVYRGTEFLVVGFNERAVEIVSTDEKLARKMGMSLVDRGTYSLEVPMEKVEGYREQIEDIDIP